MCDESLILVAFAGIRTRPPHFCSVVQYCVVVMTPRSGIRASHARERREVERRARPPVSSPQKARWNTVSTRGGAADGDEEAALLLPTSCRQPTSSVSAERGQAACYALFCYGHSRRVSLIQMNCGLYF